MFVGNSTTVEINGETIRTAIEEYLNRRVLPGQELQVVSFKVVKGNNYSEDDHITVDLKAVIPTKKEAA